MAGGVGVDEKERLMKGAGEARPLGCAMGAGEGRERRERRLGTMRDEGRMRDDEGR